MSALAAGFTSMPASNRGRHGKNLRQLLPLPALSAPDADILDMRDIPDIEVFDLTLDSREVKPGAAFVALPGARTHGIQHAAQAIAAGARAILWEPTQGMPAPEVPAGVASIAIAQLTRRLGVLADRFFDAPSRALRVAGVTGTNGKTTTAHVIAAALEQLGERSAYAGTLGVGRIGALREAAHTTPDAITTHRRLAELRDQGVRSLGMEVSSHALDQHRVDGVRFDAAVFTNLTRDHLDYHGTLAAYGAAKKRLFAWPRLRHAIVNGEDAYGRELAAAIAGAADPDPRLLCYGPSAAQSASDAAASEVRQLYARAVSVAPTGLCIDIDGSWGRARLHARFVGAFNVENLLAALGTLLSWDIPLQEAVTALECCTAPPGRMETLSVEGGPLAIVDYAHTPDALEKALMAVRAHCAGRLICVFGCGGDRDPGKRPVMGAIAERLADLVLVTDDNPRTEDGDAIVAQIVAGMSDPTRALIQRDRAAAIERALKEAAPGDAVLIAGKGHESYQIVGAERRPFSDREIAQAALASRRRVSNEESASGQGRRPGGQP